MNRRLATIARGVLIVVIAIMLCRVFWIADKKETGFQSLGHHWYDALAGLVGASHTPLYSRDAVEQAEYWLDEIARLQERRGSSPELLMACSLLLDCPSPGFHSNYLKKMYGTSAFGVIPDYDTDAILLAADAFERKCRDRCMELAARATQLDPANLDWWRIRALLLWRGDEPRTPDWEQVLDLCAQHDPENALYDYLAARYFWIQSVEFEYTQQGDEVLIKDEQLFQRAIDCFERGQRKPVFHVGDEGYRITADLLSHTSLRLTEHPKLVNSRDIHGRLASLLVNLWRWQTTRCDLLLADGDLNSALLMHRQSLYVMEQYIRASEAMAYDQLAADLRSRTAMAMFSLASENEDSLSANQLADTQEIAENALFEQRLAQKAVAAIMTPPSLSRSGVTYNATAVEMAAAVLCEAVAPVVLVVTIIGLLAIALSRIRKPRREMNSAGPIGHGFALAFSIPVSFVVFGLAPSGLISKRLQSWSLSLLTIAALIPVVIWIVRHLHRRRRLKFSLRMLLFGTLASSILCYCVAVWEPELFSSVRFPFDLQIPAVGSKGVDAESLELLIRPVGKGLWALVQWINYRGPFVAVGLWATIVVLIVSRSLANRHRYAETERFSFREHISAAGQSLGMPAMYIAGVLLAVDLFLLPVSLERIEQSFQKDISFGRNPTEYRLRVNRAAERLRMDAPLIAELREEARIELADDDTAAQGQQTSDVP